MSAGIVVPSKGSAIRNDLTLNNLKTKQSTNIPKFPNGKLPLPGSYLAVQGNLAFEQSATPGLENTDGSLMIFDGTSWVAAGGDVFGPVGATDNAVARFDGATGKVIQNSLVIIDDAGNVTTPGTVTASNISGTNTGNVTLAAVDSNGAPNANAATLSGVTGQVLNLNSASATQPGVVNTTTQSFLGAKTFVTTVGVPNTTSSTAGVYTVGGIPFLHNAGVAATNVFLGANTGNFTLTGAGNIGVGGSVLDSVTTGVNNIGMGTNSLSSVTTGADNIALGLATLQNITSGGQNVAIGSSSLSTATAGSNQNTAIGYNTLQPITTGFGNIALGHNSGSAIPSTADHTVTIAHSGAGIANGSIHIGSAGTQTTTFISGIQGVTPAGALSQVVIDTNGQLGSGALGVNDIGSVVAGTAANEGANITTSGNTSTLHLEFTDATHNGIVSTVAQTFSGDKTFSNNIIFPNATSTATQGTIYKTTHTFLHNFGGDVSNVFLGYDAGNFSFTGNQNIGIGQEVLNSLTTGGSNTCVGSSSGTNLTTGGANTCLGQNTLLTATSSNNNVAIGNHALQQTTTASINTAIGFNTLGALMTDDGNTGVGNNVLEALTSGVSNTALGTFAGQELVTGSNNIYINNLGNAVESNTIRIGEAPQTRCFISGIRGVVTGVADAINVVIDSAGQIGTTSSSARYKNTIQDMGDVSSPLLELRPVTFFYNDHDESTRKLQYGLIAEEVDKVMKGIVVYDKEGRPETVQYQFLAPLLLNEVIKQQKHILSLEEKLDTLLRNLGQH